jgi:hypothetical protein
MPIKEEEECFNLTVGHIQALQIVRSIGDA